MQNDLTATDATSIGDDATQVLPAGATSPTSRMPHGRQRAAARAFWVLTFILVAALFIIGMPEQYRALTTQTDKYPEYWDIGLQPLGISHTAAGLYDLSLDTASVIIFMAVGLLLFVKRPNDPMAYLASLMLITWGVFVTNDVVEVLTTVQPVYQLPYHLLTVVGSTALVWFIVAMPNGRFVPRWTRWLVAAYGLYSLVASVTLLGFIPSGGRDLIGFLVPLTVFLTSAGAQVYRRTLKSTTTTQKQQTKWVLVGLTLTLLAYVTSFLLPHVFPILRVPGPLMTMYQMALQVYYFIFLDAIPVTIAFSVFRYRLWDIDLAVNRSVVFGALTVFLGGIFLGVAVGVQWIVTGLFGQGQAGLAIALSALVIGALFNPARQRVQRFVDRRLYGIAINFRDPKPATLRPLPTDSTPILKRFGPYTATAIIGRGGMGDVYRGRHNTLTREVAIKVLPASNAEKATLRERFEREAQTVSALHHPNIVQLYDFGEVDTEYYMVMEYIRGETLSAMLRRRGALPLTEALPILNDVASALDYAHAQGVIHRDVKPSNIMLRAEQRRAVLMDFGIAKTNTDGGLTKIGGVVGTLNYMAPEQITGLKEVDGRADVYSLAVVTYETLTGVLPFPGDSPGAVLFGHLQRPAPDPREQNTALSTGAAAAIRRALSKKAEDRYGTAAAFVSALGE